MRRFFYHYNKPASKKSDRNIMTLHWKDKCHPVNGIICNVPTESHDQKRQPHCIVRGFAKNVQFIEDHPQYLTPNLTAIIE